MNVTNPYEPPSPRSKSGAWRPIDYLTAVCWLALPVGVFLAQQLLLPVYLDFEVQLPTATQHLLHPISPLACTLAAFVVLLAVFSIPEGRLRRRFMWLAGLSGVLFAALCLLAFLAPLFSLFQNLQ